MQNFFVDKVKFVDSCSSFLRQLGNSDYVKADALMSKEFGESENINIASSHLDTVTLPVLYIKKKKVMQLSLFLRIN